MDTDGPTTGEGLHVLPRRRALFGVTSGVKGFLYREEAFPGPASRLIPFRGVVAAVLFLRPLQVFAAPFSLTLPVAGRTPTVLFRMTLPAMRDRAQLGTAFVNPFRVDRLGDLFHVGRIHAKRVRAAVIDC